MNKIIILLFSTFFLSCVSTNNKNNITKTKFTGIKIVKTTKIINNDTISFNELRFYNIDSAMDTMKSMYLDFGLWNNKAESLNQSNITRKIWENVNLLNNQEKFIVIADGTETVKDYYASLIVFDSNETDCFEENHPLKDDLIIFFYNRMNVNKKRKIDYSIVR